MPQSPISRTESGSVSAIKNFLFGGVLDPSRPHPDGTEGEGRRQGKSQIFKVPILRSQVFRPQVFKSQIVKTKVQRGCEYKTVELDDNFPNNLRSGFSHAGPAHRFHLPKLNNVTSSSSNLRWPAATPLNVESKELPQYASTPNLSCDLQEAGTGGYRGAGATGTGTLPRNLHLARTQRYLPGVLATAPLPSSSSSSSSSCAHSGNTTLDSGFHSDATWTDTDSQSQQDAGAPLPQDVPEYRRGSWDVTPSVHGPQVPPRGSRRKGKQVSSVILKIEKGLFATASKDSTCEKPPRARDRRPIDPSSATLPLPPLPSSPPPPLPPADSKEEERGEEETTADFKTASISPGGTFLARCVKIHDLSNHESGEDGRDIGSPRHAPERRESGRFPSAARLLRSLGRSNRDDSGSGAQGRDSDARLSRANPSYHSEGKGLKKKNNWTSERELNHSLSPTQKERSHSFCEKSNSASKRRYSYHDNKTLREESRGRLERQESNQGGSSTLASPAHSLDQSQPPTSTPLSSQPHQPPICTSATTPPPCTPSPAASSSSSPSSSSSSSTTPTLPKSVSSQPPSPIDNSPTENIYENLPPRKVKSDTANSDGGGEGGHGRVLERGERERRSSRKLTKDSGYETSPYSESDYANIDLYSEVDASGEVDGDGDDVTLAPESELASPPSPSASRHPDSAAAPLPPRPPTHPGRMSHDSLERRCSWQEQSIQDAPGDANISPTEGRSATPSPRLERAAAQGAALETNSSFVRNLCGRSSRRSPLPRYSSAESLSSFAESLVSPGSTASGVASSSLVPAKSTPSLHQDASHGPAPARNPAVNVALHVSRSTPNLDDPDDGGSTSSSMVTKSSMYSYLHGASTSTSSKGGSGAASGRYWDPTMGSDDTPDREDYAHHLRSSSYQMLHSRQLSALSTGSAGSYHSRQHSNASNYSEPDDLSPRGDLHHHSAAHSHHHHHHGMDRARFFSYDNLGPDGSSSTSSQKYHVSWNVSEPDLTLAPPPYSPPGPGFQQVVGPPVSPKVTSPAPSTSTSSPTSTSNTTRHPASPPPPPVRDASSLKYIKYGPGHEKYPSWPVPAANQVLTLAPAAHDANVSGLPDSPPQSSGPQGSHRSKSWTEQSEYPKEKAAGYARPYSNKKPANRQLKTVIERAEKIPKEMFHNSGLRDDVFAPSSNYSFMDAYYKPSSSPYYPLYDREGRALDDKDYSIPSPPERDLGMGEASLGQVTAAQLEEYVRRYEEFGYTDLIGTTPLLDQLRRESVMWDGGSERDSGRGESESVAESARYSNGRESVTTVVTNSSSASSSETLKWHGSLSDISIMSGHSRDPRGDHNIAHSARVQAPQRHNSESVLYYGPEGRAKGSGSSRHSHDTREHHRRPHPADPGYPRHPREGGKWSREVVERNNEMNNLKKFPSYSYTQPLSQITESPTAEMRETPRSPQSPTIDFSKPPTVAERIHELEKQSRTSGPESGTRWPRDQSGSRERDHQDHRKVREESALQDPRDAIEKTEARSPREASETRTHQRRGSRDSQRGDRDLRLDFANTSSRKGDTSLPGVDLCSPTTPTGSASTSSRSPTQRDADSRTFIHENFQNILNSFTEVDRSDRSSGVSYSYLDPEKRRKVPDSTLKSIQKQAVMSFYERHAGRNLGVGTDVSSSGSQSSLTSSHSAPEMHQGKWANASHPSQSQNLRTDKSGRAGKGVARLGRVPESEDDQPLRPGRRRSSGRVDSSSEISAEDASRGDSQRSSLASESTSSRGEQPPALPQKMSLQSQPEGTPWSSPSLPPVNPAPEDTPTTSTPTITTTTTTPGEDQAPQDAPAEDDSGVTSRTSAGHDTLATQQLEAPRPPSLPPSHPSDPPPRPPERPPKKPTLRSLFHGPNPDTSAQNLAAAAEPSDRIPSDVDPRRIEDSGGECLNLSPARPYYYRKPPAPDPPKSPPAPACPPQQPTVATPPSPKLSRSPATLPHPSSTHAAHLVPPTSAASRSSTPDLPPPPPPPIPDGEVLISDEPLPPPPTNLEVATPMEAPPLPPESPPRERLLGTPPPVPRENGKSLPAQQTYHKDSYMAHRRDWKTGFEGRYRRTTSPSGSSRNLLSSTIPATTTTTSTAPASLHPTSSTITATTTTTTTTTTSSSLIGQNDTPNESEIITSENGWGNGGYMRNTSTTVSFTAEELRAFKARRAHAQDLSTHTPDKENTSRKLHSSQSSPSLSSSALQSVASEGSTSSLASGGTVSSLGSGRSVGSVCSGGVSPVSPSKLSPAHSWRTSLESLNRANSTTVPSSISNGNSGSSSSHSPRTITRATSLADPLHSSEEVGMSGRATQDSYQLPRTASINESLSRITAISDSLSRSTSVADSLAGQSFAAETLSQGNNNTEMLLLPCQSVEPPSLPLAPASPTSPVAHDGPVTARPATVTEEATSPVMPSIKAAQVSSLSVASKSPASSKSTSSTIHAQATPAIKSSSPVTTSTFSEGINSNPATCPSTDSNSNYDVVVLGYGRTPYPEELECDRLSKDYVPQFPMDNKLRALFATGPEHKTTAHYMEGVFSLELRKDFISSSHARHPDLVQVGLSQTAAPKSVSSIQNNNETTNGVEMTHDRTPLPADSAYFTTSESKAKMLTRLRGSTGNLQESLTDQQLMKKKEELVASIGRKLEILRAEHEAIKDEMRLNHDLGAEVTSRVEAMARLAESEKYKLHVEEIDKITSLLLGLSGRLARAENALMMVEDIDLEEKRILENKRDKLHDQLEEAKKLKENIDRRAVQVSKVLNKYLTEDQYADYDHFIKMKAKLIMDAKEIDDKIKLGEEQQKALRETIFKKQ